MRSLTAISAGGRRWPRWRCRPAGARRRSPPPACSPRSPTTSPTARACSAGSPARPKTTWNVVGDCGDRDAPRTLVVLAHHDAAPTGAIFDQTFQAWLGETFPGLIERIDTSFPLWWALLAAPALVASGALRGRRGLLGRGRRRLRGRPGHLRRRRPQPDRAGRQRQSSAVAVLVALAERLRDEPIEGCACCSPPAAPRRSSRAGSTASPAATSRALDRDRTWFLNLETVGSPRLVMLEGEGPVMMEDYHDRGFRDLVCAAAQRAGVSWSARSARPELDRRRASPAAPAIRRPRWRR